MKRRSTPAKEAVLSVLSGTNRAMSQDAIEQRIGVDVDRATIYRILNRFCDDGLLHKIVGEDGKQYFGLCVRCDATVIPAHHFHFRCNSCQTVECLPSGVRFVLPEGYAVEKVNCVLSGVCGDCSN